MTYVFLDEEKGTYVAVYGNDLYDVATDLDLSAATGFGTTSRVAYTESSSFIKFKLFI